MGYASQEQALKPPIHEYSRLACAIREWEVIRDWTRTHVILIAFRNLIRSQLIFVN